MTSTFRPFSPSRAGIVALVALFSQFAVPQQPQQNVPDAPSATRPAPAQLPKNVPPAATSAPDTPQQQPQTNPEPPPPNTIKTVPAGSVPPDQTEGRDDIYTIIRRVNQVTVPVTVKDSNGRLVEGLLKNDFSVYEDGKEQTLNFFTSDPFPLSAAVVLDLGMPEEVVRKVNETLPALAGAFSPYDEVALYVYGNTVSKTLDFSAANDRFSSALTRVKKPGRTGGVPVVSGPMASGPTINNVPFDPSVPHVSTPRRESRVLNDAILAAAIDLAHRAPTRRKVIFVISDGREIGSKVGYSDVLKSLLTNNINVYAVNVGASAIPGYRNAERINIPFSGSGNILPKYASSTGGQVFPEFDRDAIERAYAEVTGQARNQYTLGYSTRATPSTDYRSIEVRIHRGGLKVIARDGYFPIPRAR
jgi:VWFA-related protein